MSRTGEQWIKATGGLGLGETPDSLQAKAEMIADLEQRLLSGELSPDEREAVLTQIRNLKGSPRWSSITTHQMTTAKTI